MDLSKLDSISTEGLTAMRDRCIELLEKRKATTLRIGAIGWFIDRNRVKRHMVVTRVNHKTVSGWEVDPITRARIGVGNWRVSPSLLTVIPDQKSLATPRPQPHLPTTTAGLSW